MKTTAIEPDPEVWEEVTKLMVAAALQLHGQRVSAWVAEDYSKARSMTAHLMAAMTAVRELPCPTEPLEIYPDGQ